MGHRCKKNDLFYQSICHPLGLLKIPQVAILGDLYFLKDSCFFFRILVQPHCPQKFPAKLRAPNPSPRSFSQSRKTVNLWPGQIPDKGQVQLRQGYKKPLSTILCSRLISWSEYVLAPFWSKEIALSRLSLSLLCLFLAQEGLYFQHREYPRNLKLSSGCVHSNSFCPSRF
jgi:hypothetical protein